MNREKIKSIALDCGFTLRDGDDLSPYVYEFADRLIEPQAELLAALEKCVEAMQWDVGGEPLPSLELEAIENAKRVIAEVRGS